MLRLLALTFLIPAAAMARPPVVDVHAHLDPHAHDRIMALMNQAGVAVLVNLSGGNFAGGLPEAEALAEATGGRVVNFYTPDWDGVDEPWWGVQEAVRLERAVRQHGFRGLKISKALGLYLRDAVGVLIDVDDPRLDPLWEKAGELGVPVAIHTGDPKAFWQPPTPDNERYDELRHHPSWSFYGKPVPSREELLAQRDRLLERHPLTTFICVHFGNNPEDLDYVANLLATYPNAMVDLAARVPEIGRHPPEAVREVFVRFQDRILFGTDIGIGPQFLMLGSTGGDRPTDADAQQFYRTHWRFLETNDRGFAHPTPIQGNWTIDAIGLPADVLHKIYQDNALKLLNLRLSRED